MVKSVLEEWHKVCLEDGSNDQIAWNKVRSALATVCTSQSDHASIATHCLQQRDTEGTCAQIFDAEWRKKLQYHIMTKELYPNGDLLETRRYSRNDTSVRQVLHARLMINLEEVLLQFPYANMLHRMTVDLVHQVNQSVISLLLMQSAWRPAWVHANYRVGYHNKRQFLIDSSVWQGGNESDKPSCEVPDE